MGRPSILACYFTESNQARHVHLIGNAATIGEQFSSPDDFFWNLIQKHVGSLALTNSYAGDKNLFLKKRERNFVKRFIGRIDDVEITYPLLLVVVENYSKGLTF